MTTQWGFVTNHGRVLLCITQDPDVRLRDIAMRLGITERRAYDIVTDLIDTGYLVKTKEGRRNRYEVQAAEPLPDNTGPGAVDRRRPRLPRRPRAVHPAPTSQRPLHGPTSRQWAGPPGRGVNGAAPGLTFRPVAVAGRRARSVAVAVAARRVINA